MSGVKEDLNENFNELNTFIKDFRQTSDIDALSVSDKEPIKNKFNMTKMLDESQNFSNNSSSSRKTKKYNKYLLRN